jgi:hypothetical protein
MVYAPYEPVSTEVCVMAPRERLTWASRVTVGTRVVRSGEASVGSAPAARAESSLGRIQLRYTAPFDDLRLR